MTKSTMDQAMTTGEVASRFNELAKQEKWFEIQDELFSDDVKSIDPPNSSYFGYAEGKADVRKTIVDLEGYFPTFPGMTEPDELKMIDDFFTMVFAEDTETLKSLSTQHAQ